jgi:hypothetical protein
MNLAQQIRAAALHYARIQVERAERDVKKQRRGSSNNRGVTRTVVERLPRGADAALTVAEVCALLSDIEFSKNGLSGLLTTLIDRGEVMRRGSSGHYRYYKP